MRDQPKPYLINSIQTWPRHVSYRGGGGINNQHIHDKIPLYPWRPGCMVPMYLYEALTDNITFQVLKHLNRKPLLRLFSDFPCIATDADEK